MVLILFLKLMKDFIRFLICAIKKLLRVVTEKTEEEKKSDGPADIQRV